MHGKRSALDCKNKYFNHMRKERDAQRRARLAGAQLEPVGGHGHGTHRSPACGDHATGPAQERGPGTVRHVCGEARVGLWPLEWTRAGSYSLEWLTRSITTAVARIVTSSSPSTMSMP